MPPHASPGPALALSLALALLPVGARAMDCGAAPSQLILRSDNDVYGRAGQDQNYTAGASATYVSATLQGEDAGDCLPAPLAALDRGTRWLRRGEGGQRNLVLTWHHAIYTPVDGTRADLITDDRPYAATVMLGIGHHVRDGERLASTRLSLGMLGPSAQGEMAQDAIHRLFGRPRFEGWDNQLRDEPLLQLDHERRWRLRRERRDEGLGWDLTTHAGASLGNAYVHANGGVEWRWGRGLPDDFGTAPFRLAGDNQAPGPARAPARRLDWHVFAALDLRAVGRDITLDGNTWKDGHSVDRRALVGELSLGIAATWGPWKAAYANIRRSEEFDGQGERPVTGTITLSRSF